MFGGKLLAKMVMERGAELPWWELTQADLDVFAGRPAKKDEGEGGEQEGEKEDEEGYNRNVPYDP